MTGLSIGDGFKFGCGFILSYLVFMIGIGVLMLLITVVLGMVGMGGAVNFQNMIKPTSMLLSGGCFV